jgi:hypothetical protein
VFLLCFEQQQKKIVRNFKLPRIDEEKFDPMFCQLSELAEKECELVWKESGRWLKFQELVELGSQRWSRPHVATLSAHALTQLKSVINQGAVFLDAFFVLTLANFVGNSTDLLLLLLLCQSDNLARKTIYTYDN